eukprot:Gregarina_sp_Poly_1__4314@NODE_2340_length_2259_cov_295_789690_g1496_i0_p1_GENE_NODE_2340_length_2259_cov_295_789690_g1496_i0NODE_2340_length_2259_cov_295_789690_g1496_i0_p1_ORF_typecomplete_len308_score41_21adh_short/PF00106_25/3_2e39adh_short_C2/PF13561_6/2_4e25KR/PF08659_10/1_3e09Sacchrp_dh_NADP/PF03435_18/0_0018Sacchrp_dh_NADP/PF03435_18/2_9e03CdAMP_rec/PF06153_11/0_27CdAMP_rec/PF06153_11/3_3e02Polysacc_synt_2/PF02719_15/0_028DUF1776/PF08643_10/0_03DUF520/PF04461_13/0_066Shikimate_DH/PF01488
MLFLIGCIAAVTFVLHWVALCYAWFQPKRQLEDFGPWAVITGCTDGIGKEYAIQISKKKSNNLFLIGRSQEKLEALVEIIKSDSFTKEIKTHVFDFAKPSEELWKKLESELAALEVGLLINNVGVSYPTALNLTQTPSNLLEEIIDVNVRSVLRMTHMVIKGMCDRSRGAVLCIGSAAGEFGTPMLAGYAASKAAVSGFCRSLQAECRQRNVIVQCQNPMFVTSKMSKIRRSSLVVPSTATFVEWSLRVLLGTTLVGILETPCVVSPYPIHAAIIDLMVRVPSMVSERYQLSQQRAVQQKAMNKKVA